MARACTICQHADTEAIDLELVRGETATRIAAKYRVSEDALSRHHAHHVRPAATRVHAAVQARAEHELDLSAELHSRLQRADRLVSIAETVLARAAQDGDHRTAIAGVGAATRALGEARACLELQARVAGRLDAGVDQRLSALEEQLQHFSRRPWANRWSA